MVWDDGEEKPIALRCTVEVTDCKFFDNMRYMVFFFYFLSRSRFIWLEEDL
jgi:hypothetical protein